LISEGVLDPQDRRQQQVFLAAEVFVDQLDGQGLIVSEIGGRAKPLDTEILGDDGLHDLRRSAVDRLDAGVDERA